jgi:DNA-directed RNA polymerase specialized sigma24 family protein
MEPRAADHSGAFKPTRWSLVLRANDRREPAAAAALDELCAAYWYPLYCFARRRGLSAPDAEDATQGFFARILEKETLASTDPERGRLRTFLLTAFQRYLVNFDDHRFAQKRGGRALQISLDDAEQRFGAEPADQNSPEKIFQHQWALAVLNRTLTALAVECESRGQGAAFEIFRPLLSGVSDDSSDSYAAISARLAMTPGAARVAVHRMRKRYRDILFSQIAETLDDPSPEAVRQEIQALFAALA